MPTLIVVTGIAALEYVGRDTTGGDTVELTSEGAVKLTAEETIELRGEGTTELSDGDCADIDGRELGGGEADSVGTTMIGFPVMIGFGLPGIIDAVRGPPLDDRDSIACLFGNSTWKSIS